MSEGREPPSLARFGVNFRDLTVLVSKPEVTTRQSSLTLRRDVRASLTSRAVRNGHPPPARGHFQNAVCNASALPWWGLVPRQEFTARHSSATAQKSLHTIAEPPELKVKIGFPKLWPRYSRRTKPVNRSQPCRPKVVNRPDETPPAFGESTIMAEPLRAAPPVGVENLRSRPRDYFLSLFLSGSGALSLLLS